MFFDGHPHPPRAILEPIDPRDFERRPETPIRSRSSPDKKPICSGFNTTSISYGHEGYGYHHHPTIPSSSSTTTSHTTNTTPISSPQKNTNPSTNSSSKFTPTRKYPQPSNPSTTPITPTKLFKQPIQSPCQQPIHHHPSPASPTKPIINSPLRATLTAEAIRRKKQILPGAPNPTHHHSPPSKSPSHHPRTHLKSLSISSPFSSPLSSLRSSTYLSPTSTSPIPNRSQPRNRILSQSQSYSTPIHRTRSSLVLSSSISSSPWATGLHPTSLAQSTSPLINPSRILSSSINQPFLTTPPKPQSENVLVAIRLKGIVRDPLNFHQAPESQKICWSINPEATQIHELTTLSSSLTQPQSTPWSFDSVFGQDSTNQDVYKRSGAKDLILSAMTGYDATIFAYGQTASGKTHTLTGSMDQPGIIPLSVQEIFAFIRTHPEREFLLRVSYLEVYNEQIHDLLIPSNEHTPPPVRIRQQSNGMFFADPVREEVVTNVAQVADLMIKGERQRHVAGTDWNARSSRSHTIFGIVIESRLNGFDGGVRRSKVCLIDLAGNERASSEVERRSEGAFINKSLLTLEKVISGLAEASGGLNRKRSQHIPYRDSKLTQILQPSLSGEARVCVICTMNGTFKSIEDSRSTLRFATRVKKVQTSAGVNEILTDSALIIRYRQQIADLQAQLTDAVKKTSDSSENVNHNQLIDQSNSRKLIEETQVQAKKAEEERRKIKKQLTELQSIILNADNLDEQERTSKQTRPVSPVKKPSNLSWSMKSDSESESSDEGESKEPDGGKSKREKELEEKIQLQAYEIACLRLELVGLNHKKMEKTRVFSKLLNQGQDHDSKEEGRDRVCGEIDDHGHPTEFSTSANCSLDLEIEQAEKRVAESRETLENRLAQLSLEIKKRKKFSQDVVNLLEASRAKTRKLELFILKELEKSTRRLSRIERNTYTKLNQNDEKENVKINSRRRSHSLSDSHPYDESLRNSNLSLISTTDRKSRLDRPLSLIPMERDHSLEPPNRSSIREKKGVESNSLKQQQYQKQQQEEEEEKEKEDEEEISRLLSIVDELPELEFVRMSFKAEEEIEGMMRTMNLQDRKKTPNTTPTHSVTTTSPTTTTTTNTPTPTSPITVTNTVPNPLSIINHAGLRQLGLVSQYLNGRNGDLHPI